MKFTEICIAHCCNIKNENYLIQAMYVISTILNCLFFMFNFQKWKETLTLIEEQFKPFNYLVRLVVTHEVPNVFVYACFNCLHVVT